MTVCIAALSAYIDTDQKKHPVIILAADRMITARMIREYELADQTKLVWHRNDLAVLMSGSVDTLLEAYTNVSLRVGRDCLVKDLVKELASEIQLIRRRGVEQNFLQRYNLTLDKFIARQREWTPDFFERLNSQINDPDMHLGEIIVAGIDERDGQEFPQIHTIEGAGYERAWNATGFCAIGIGAEHAEAEFAHALYTPNMPWLAALRVTGFAKKRAEEAPGVGPSTDIWYIIKGGSMYYYPQSKMIQTIQEMFSARRYAEVASIAEDAAKLDQLLTDEMNAATPRAATPEERKDAEAKAEEADRPAIDYSVVRGSAKKGQPKD